MSCANSKGSAKFFAFVNGGLGLTLSARIFIFLIASLATAVSHAAESRLSLAGHINAEINKDLARIADSCLPNASAKIERLRAEGFDVSLMIIHRHGSSDTHALVHMRLDGVTYYLNNSTNIMATEWSELYDVVEVRDR